MPGPNTYIHILVYPEMVGNLENMNTASSKQIAGFLWFLRSRKYVVVNQQEDSRRDKRDSVCEGFEWGQPSFVRSQCLQVAVVKSNFL